LPLGHEHGLRSAQNKYHGSCRPPPAFFAARLCSIVSAWEENWRDAGKQRPDFLYSETPFYVERAVAALAADPEVKKKSGQVFGSWTLSDEHGFTDADGARARTGAAILPRSTTRKEVQRALYRYSGRIRSRSPSPTGREDIETPEGVILSVGVLGKPPAFTRPGSNPFSVQPSRNQQ